jgi:hypothetical protein
LFSIFLNVALPAIGTFLGFLVATLKNAGELKQAYRSLRGSKTVIAIVNAPVPETLRKYRDFSDIKKAMRCSDEIVILHCRTLSYALRFCDFVCAEASDDVKIHAPNDPFWDCFTE